MRSHISVHRVTTKYFSNSFVFKTEIEKEGLPGDITPAWSTGVLVGTASRNRGFGNSRPPCGIRNAQAVLGQRKPHIG
jgi:hypothetical protein